ncbi:hypothetical protein MUK42_35863 [Musa troglodytarum]|uniref:Uncharacterized protein n=1 Tax=Musa troglodytarum TaxID=320322 RepID=A0A9E7JUH5_9LILI|nr:hypothetical protein MUK42_35863 [Musa troglodytarum]
MVESEPWSWRQPSCRQLRLLLSRLMDDRLCHCLRWGGFLTPIRGGTTEVTGSQGSTETQSDSKNYQESSSLVQSLFLCLETAARLYHAENPK